MDAYPWGLKVLDRWWLHDPCRRAAGGCLAQPTRIPGRRGSSVSMPMNQIEPPTRSLGGLTLDGEESEICGCNEAT
jgi:hypothetical protein